MKTAKLCVVAAFVLALASGAFAQGRGPGGGGGCQGMNGQQSMGQSLASQGMKNFSMLQNSGTSSLQSQIYAQQQMLQQQQMQMQLVQQQQKALAQQAAEKQAKKDRRIANWTSRREAEEAAKLQRKMQSSYVSKVSR